MMRLIDYFAIAGYDIEQDLIGSNRKSGRIIQRFPEDDLNDCEFDNNIQCFCQPHGWKIYTKQEPPTYFVSILTDERALRRYCACLTFLEPLQYSTTNSNNSNDTTTTTTNKTRTLSTSGNYVTIKTTTTVTTGGQTTTITQSLDDSNYLNSADEYEDSEFINENMFDTNNSESISNIMPIGPCRRYAPKSLIIVSKFDYYDLFKNILSLIYAIYVDNRDIKLELVISNLLLVNIHASGTGALTSFTLGADDRHFIQSNASTSVPNTGTCVYNLFKELGVNHVLKLVCSILADYKIIFFSRSYSKLTEACIALEALLFPLKFAGAFVPILPCLDMFLDIPAAPTPYIIGIHSSYRTSIEEMHQDCLQDVVKVDLDGSSVNIPPNVDAVANLPDYLNESTLNLLFSILKPELLKPDEAFQSTSSPFSNFKTFNISNNASIYMPHQLTSTADLNSHTSSASSSTSNTSGTTSGGGNGGGGVSASNSSTTNTTATTSVNLIQTYDPIWIDKQIRAIFIRLFAQLFAGYRYCLLIIRINPKPVICFHKANFLGHHDLVNNEFMNRLLDSMSFQKFIEERGPPFRNCDIFDDIYASVQLHLRDELKEPELIGLHIQEITEKLFKYEYPQTNFESYLSYLKSQNQLITGHTSSYQRNIYNSYNNHGNHHHNHHHTHHSHKHHFSSSQNLLYYTPLRTYSKIQSPTQDAFTRIYFQTFPILDANEVNRLLTQSTVTHTSSSDISISTSNSQQNTPRTPHHHLCRPYLVPYGPPIETVNKLKYLNTTNIKSSSTSGAANANTHGYMDNIDIWNISCARKLEVVSNCVTHIFDNNFKDVKKNFNSTLRALKDPRARLHLCTCFQRYVKRNQVILNNEQFDCICKILNEALQNDSRLDEFGVAYSVLQFASAFYRKLNNGTVDQCIYTKLQSHPVWDNMQFWEMAFYTDVQKSIRPVYLTNEEFDAEQAKENRVIDDQFSKTNEFTTTQDTSATTTTTKLAGLIESPAKTIGILQLNLNLHSRPAEKTALEICGEQMEKFTSYSKEQQDNFIRNEQGIIRSHVLHYISQMVNMKIPLDISKSIYSNTNIAHSHHNENMLNNQAYQQQNHLQHHGSNGSASANKSSNNYSNQQHSRNHSSSINNGVYEDFESVQTDNEVSIQSNTGVIVDAASIASDDSGYENGGGYSYGLGEAGYSVWKFVSKFVDRVCEEGLLNDSQKQSLHNNLTEVVSMQISTLESVYQESKRIPPRIKPKIEFLKPDCLLPNEYIHDTTPLRCYLVPDGREEVTGVSGGPILIPAEGVLFLTNYRIIYRGIPTDPLVSDAIITRAFPIAALTKEKKLSGQYHSENSNSLLHDGLQLRSCTFQLIRVYFDEEVTSDRIEKFRQTLMKMRYPQTVFESFCLSAYFHGNNYYQQTLSNKSKENTSQALKHFAKNTLRKAGLMPRNSNRKLPLSARTPELSRKLSRTSRSNELSLSGDYNQVNAIIITNNGTLASSVPNNNTPMISDFDEDSLAVISEVSDNFTNQITTLIGHDEKRLERWFENALAYKDYIRQGLISVHRKSSTHDSFKIFWENVNYQFCRSYPAMFIVPKDISDECIRKNAKCHRQNRLPVIVWRHPQTKALLLRGSSFLGKGIIGMLMKGQTTSSTSSDTSASMEQDKYIMEIVKLTKPLFMDIINSIGGGGSGANNEQTVTSAVPQQQQQQSSITPITHRRRNLASKIEKAVQNIKPNFHLTSHNNHNKSTSSYYNTSSAQTNIYGSGSGSSSSAGGAGYISNTPNSAIYSNNNNNNNNNPISISNYAKSSNGNLSSKFNTIATTSHGGYTRNNTLQIRNENKSNQLSLYSSNTSNYDNNSNISQNQESDIHDLNDSFNSVKRGVPLYIICEKAQIRTFRSETSKETRYAFIPVDVCEVREMKNCFKKFLRASVPSTPSEFNETSVNHHSNHNQYSFLKQIHDSKWFDSIQQIINISNLIVERMEDSSSVMICLEDGWDMTAQLSSTVEILQDPYYRTIEGFSVLIEREWLSMGHRFTRRNNHTIDDQTGFAPIFLQFLDVVHQILNQFPHEFEFNEFYLEFLAYHYVSNRFKTFLLDSEYERSQFGLSTSDSTSRNNYNGAYTTLAYNHTNTLMNSSQSNTNTMINNATLNNRNTNDANTNTITSNNVTNKTENTTLITCIWEYIQRVHHNSSKFYNFDYDVNSQQIVLKPSSAIEKIKLWRYYTKEALCTGPVYDLDLIALSSDEYSYPVPIKNAIDYYEDLNSIIPSQFEILVRELTRKIKTENPQVIINAIGLPSSLITWKHVWDYYCKQATNKIHKSQNISNALSNSKPFVDQHSFERCVCSTTTPCHVCNMHFKASSTGYKCKMCLLTCHEKCIDNVNVNCVNARMSHTSDYNKSTLNLSNGRYSLTSSTKVDLDIGSASIIGINSSTNKYQTTVESNVYSPSNTKYSSRSVQSNTENDAFMNWPALNHSTNEHQTYAGYLRKQGAFFKQWKERYFVLDSVKHQLRYYESASDTVVRGVIDLSDVESITQGGLTIHHQTPTSQTSTSSPYTQQQTRKSNSNSNSEECCFELKTSKRVYYFCAKSPQEATKWKELLETCLDS